MNALCKNQLNRTTNWPWTKFMIKTVRIENASKWRLCSRTERWPYGSPIQSPLFRMKINQSWTSPSNFRSIGPQTKQDRAFDEIWAVKKKTEFFSLTSKWWFSHFSLFSPTSTFGGYEKLEEEEKKNDSFSSPFI